jgi:hypothetical protein
MNVGAFRQSAIEYGNAFGTIARAGKGDPEILTVWQKKVFGVRQQIRARCDDDLAFPSPAQQRRDAPPNVI